MVTPVSEFIELVSITQQKGIVAFPCHTCELQDSLIICDLPWKLLASFPDSPLTPLGRGESLGRRLGNFPSFIAIFLQ